MYYLMRKYYPLIFTPELTETKIQPYAIENLRLPIEYYKTSNLENEYSGIQNAAMTNFAFDFNYLLKKYVTPSYLN